MKLETLLESIEERELLEIVQDLIRIPSHLKIEQQEKQVSAFVRDELVKMGIEVDFQEVEKGRCNVIAKMKGKGGGRSLAFNGHLDTVPPGEGMRDPYLPVVKEGRLYGRGSCDMKGAVGAMMYTLLLFKKAGLTLEGDLYFTAVVGEETGGVGTRHLVQHGFRADYAIVGEPTDLTIVSSHKGVCSIEVEIRGRACHGSIPEQGSNAIVAVSDFIQKVKEKLLPELSRRTQEHVGCATLNFGVIHGGTKVNIVADRCTLELDRRWVRGESMQDAANEIESLVGEVCERDPGLHGEVRVLQPHDAYLGPLCVPEDHEVIGLVKNALRSIGRSPVVTGMQGWTDAATLHHGGTPTVIFGPGSISQAHTVEEYVEISQLIEAVKSYIAIAASVCGVT